MIHACRPYIFIWLEWAECLDLTDSARPDEAITDYTDLIETMTVGHEFIADTFGEGAAPRFGFQVSEDAPLGDHATTLQNTH